jgi:hypothetical protein
MEGNKIFLGAVFDFLPWFLMEPVAWVVTLPQVKKSVDVTMMQPENGVEGGHWDGAHVAYASAICTAADEVLLTSQPRCPKGLKVKGKKYLRGHCCESALG